MKKIQIPSEVIDALETAITRAVQDRIDNDPDVEDTYLRISAEDNKFTVQVMYIEESNAQFPNHDVALLNLMYDTNQAVDNEAWIPDEEAIRALAESYSEMYAVYICPN